MSGLYAVILAGGSGTRLWPFSRQNFPKQLLKLSQDGQYSLLQETIRRIESRISPENMIFLTSEHLVPQIRSQISEYLGDASKLCRIVGEPLARNTGPAILLGALIVHSRDPDGLVLALPSDHVIEDVSAFSRAIDTSLDAARDGFIVTYGIRPARPETGYGYIRAGERVGSVYRVDRFEEKPGPERAREFFEDPDYSWNSGIFLFSANSILEEAGKHRPDLLKQLEGIDLEHFTNIREIFESIDPISIDYGIMEKTARAAILPTTMGWSDLGSWDSFHETGVKDDKGNVVSGNVICLDTTDSLLLESGKVMAVSGMKDVIVVDTDDALLVCPRGRSQDVKMVVARLDKEGMREHIDHPLVRRPWGTYLVLDEGTGYKVKKIVVEPGQKLSLQLHKHRSEHWVFVKGEAVVVCDEEVKTVGVNDRIFVPAGVKHRVINDGTVPAEFIEVQYGDYLEEDDIIRFEDVYGRVD